MAGINKNYKIVDLFAGIGGLSYGFKKNGFELLFANDFDKDCCSTFLENFPKEKYFLDPIENLDEIYLNKKFGHVPKTDVLVGGVPCQPFSMSGYRNRENFKNSYDGRTYLYKEFLRLATLLQPKILIIENVKGIVSLKGGTVFRDILNSIERLGYISDYKVINAASYGAPQLRERVIIVANNIGQKNLFPKPSHQKENFENVKNIFIKKKHMPNHDPKMLSGLNLERMMLLKPGQNWKNLPKKYQTKSQHSGAYGRIDPTKPSRTITTRFDTPSVGFVTLPFENRTLTVREGARIQMIPDNFILKGGKMSQFKQVGNAVPFNISEHFTKTVKRMLDNES